MSNLHFDLSLKYCNNVIPSIPFVSAEAVEVKKDAESSPVEVRTDERATKEDNNTKSPAKPAAASEQTEQKETTPKGEKEQDEKVRNVQAMV